MEIVTRCDSAAGLIKGKWDEVGEMRMALRELGPKTVSRNESSKLIK